MNINNIAFKVDAENIRFKKVKISDVDFLYELLLQRETNTNISHKKCLRFYNIRDL